MKKRRGNLPEPGYTKYEPAMFDMYPFGGKKVSSTKYQESGISFRWRKVGQLLDMEPDGAGYGAGNFRLTPKPETTEKPADVAKESLPPAPPSRKAKDL